MVKLLSTVVLVLMLFLLIPTGLVLASQNSLPGDGMYPIKRRMEDLIVSAASLHPATQAYFKVGFAKRRFLEASTLLARQDPRANQSLGELSAQTADVLDEIKKLDDKQKKEELIKQVIRNIEEYNNGLKKDRITNINPKPPTPTPTPTSSPTPYQPSTVLTPTPTPSKTSITPTLTPTPTPAPIPTPTPNNNIDKCNSGLPQSVVEAQECAKKQKYEACAIIGITDTKKCDDYSQGLTQNSTTSPSAPRTSSGLTFLALDVGPSVIPPTPTPTLSPPQANLSGPTIGTVYQPLSFSSIITSLSGITIANIWLAHPGPARVTSDEIEGFDVNKFTCQNTVTQNCAWYSVGVGNSSPLTASLKLTKPGNFIVTTSVVPAGENPFSRVCSNNPYIAYPATLAGITFYSCGSQAIDLEVK